MSRLYTRLSLPLAFCLVLASTPTSLAEDAIPVTTGVKPLSGGVHQDVLGLTDDIEIAETQVKANPDDPEAHFLLAVAYSRTPYVEKALIELDKSKRLARKHPEGFGVFDRKIAEYEKMALKAPDDTVLLYRLGFGYYMRGFAAQHRYIKAAEPSPEYFYNKAEQTFRHLVFLDPQDFSARNYLGYLLAEQDPQGNYEQAVALWRESLAITNDNPGAYILLGQAAMSQGNLREAVEYTTRAVKARNNWLQARGIDPSKLKIRL